MTTTHTYGPITLVDHLEDLIDRCAWECVGRKPDDTTLNDVALINWPKDVRRAHQRITERVCAIRRKDECECKKKHKRENDECAVTRENALAELDGINLDGKQRAAIACLIAKIAHD